MRVGSRNAWSFGLVVLSFALTGVLYSRLPDAVPVHWDASGQADGFASKPWGPFALPLTMAGTYLVLLLLPWISPKGFRIDPFRRTYEIVQVSILGFLFLLTGVSLLAAMGLEASMDRVLPAGAGLLIIVMGNFMGKVRKNFFFGIRTPWTLASDEVWLRTHRLGGKLFVLAGVVLLLSGLAGRAEATLLPSVIVAGVIPAIYSFVIYRRLEGVGKDASNQ